ncbi:MAG: DUF4349 domain-containing protein [Candidatus Villigracilaceae bacterium]
MKQSLFALLIILVALTACGAPKAEAPSQEIMPTFAGAPSAPMEMSAAYGEGSQDAAYTLQQPSQERLVIQNVDLTIVVADPKMKVEAVATLANAMGGFVVSSNIYQSQTEIGIPVPEASMTIRVPAEKLEEALTEIKSDAVEVRVENRSGQDVTKEYVDLKSRLRVYEEAEEQLRVILNEKTSPEEVLNVFDQMMHYREQIELVKGEMQYYEESAALSAIHLTMIAQEKVKPLEIGGWKLEGTTRDAVQTLINFVQGFVRFLIWLVIVILPIGLIILLLLWVLWKLIRLVWRFFLRKKTPPPASPVEQ